MGRHKVNNGECKLCGNPAEITRNKDGTVYTRALCHICRNRMYKENAIRQIQCEKCGWQGFCDKHHRDGNHFNNVEDNLEYLCPNCHRNLHSPLPDWILRIKALERDVPENIPQ